MEDFKFCIREKSLTVFMEYFSIVILPLVYLSLNTLKKNKNYSLYFQSNVILLLDPASQALRRLILPSEEFTMKKTSWWNKEEAVRNTQPAQQIAKDFL